MSIKLLAAVVFLLVSCVFASTHCYLAAERSIHSRLPQVSEDCCNTQNSCPGAAADECAGSIALESQATTRRLPHRQSLASRRRDGTTTNAWLAPVSSEDPAASAPRRS